MFRPAILLLHKLAFLLCVLGGECESMSKMGTRACTLPPKESKKAAQ